MENSFFVAEFVVLRILDEVLTGLRYNLQMFGVLLDGPCDIFCNNEAVWKSSMRAESALMKKHVSISYHKTRKVVALGMMLVFYKSSTSDNVDLFTEALNKAQQALLMKYICGKT